MRQTPAKAGRMQPGDVCGISLCANTKALYGSHRCLRFGSQSIQGHIEHMWAYVGFCYSILVYFSAILVRRLTSLGIVNRWVLDSFMGISEAWTHDDPWPWHGCQEAADEYQLRLVKLLEASHQRWM